MVGGEEGGGRGVWLFTVHPSNVDLKSSGHICMTFFLLATCYIRLAERA